MGHILEGDSQALPGLLENTSAHYLPDTEHLARIAYIVSRDLADVDHGILLEAHIHKSAEAGHVCHNALEDAVLGEPHGIHRALEHAHQGQARPGITARVRDLAHQIAPGVLVHLK